jgi:hypothetical protein
MAPIDILIKNTAYSVNFIKKNAKNNVSFSGQGIAKNRDYFTKLLAMCLF